MNIRGIIPVATVVGFILVVWTLAVIPMNAHLAADMAARADVVVTPESSRERRTLSGFVIAAQNPAIIPMAYTLERARLPSPHQVLKELYRTVVTKPPTSKQSLIYHAGITLSATILGFVIGTTLGVLLAVGIVYNRTMDKSVMPWAITSQTIPILALAPMLIVMLGAIGVQGLLPKSLISAYLSFFPVVVGMVKGLRAPDAMQTDLLQTYNASASQGFWKLRLPVSMPYLFASLKIGISAALVGTIVGELPTGAQGGLGARLLVGDQYGPPVIMWAALFGAAFTAASLVGVLALIERRTLARMGMAAT